MLLCRTKNCLSNMYAEPVSNEVDLLRYFTWVVFLLSTCNEVYFLIYFTCNEVALRVTFVNVTKYRHRAFNFCPLHYFAAHRNSIHTTRGITTRKSVICLLIR